jgi:hypothetical protein
MFLHPYSVGLDFSRAGDSGHAGRRARRFSYAPGQWKKYAGIKKIPLPQGQYYVVESRQPVGLDKIQPDSGILILKVDPAAQERNGTVRVMDADPKSPHLSRATFRLDQENRNLFVDRKNNVAVIPLWTQG